MAQIGRQAFFRAGEPGQQGREWSDLRMRFQVELTSDREPNNLVIGIFNLSESSKSHFEANQRVELIAGYKNPRSIFVGTIRHFSHNKEAQDFITEIEAADGRRAKQATINRKLPPGSSPQQIIGALKESMLGGAEQIADGFMDTIKNLPKTAKGMTLSGNAGDILSSYLEPQGFNWSIQGEEIEIRRRTEPTNEPAIFLDSARGLIGSPRRLEGGLVEVDMLLNGEAKPGRLIQLAARDVQGNFVAQNVRHTGDTHGPDWMTTAECTPL